MQSYEDFVASGLSYNDVNLDWMHSLPEVQSLVLDFLTKLLNGTPVLMEELDAATKHDFLTAAETFLQRPKVQEIFSLENALDMTRTRGPAAGDEPAAADAAIEAGDAAKSNRTL